MPITIDQAMQTAIAHHRAGRLAEASRIYRQVLLQVPKHADASHLLGLITLQSGDAKSALRFFESAVAANPTALTYQRMVGVCLLEMGRIDAAIDAFQTAMNLSRGDVETANYLGAVLTASERFAEAEQAFRSGLNPDADNGPIWNNLGNLFRVQGRADEALDAYERAIKANQKLGPAFSNLGNALRDRGKLPEAVTAYRQAVELIPDSPSVHSNLVYAVCFDPGYDAQKILDEAKRWADRHESPLIGSQRPHEIDRDPDRKLRIGYVSGDFRNHVIGRNVLPILEHHDHDRFEIHCFSTLVQHDQNTPAFVRAADKWHECATMNQAVLADRIRSEKIDILIDLTLHISGNRLMTFARKPAPVQVTWAGYPGTTGLQSIDYRITDPYLDPPGKTDQFYSEKSIRLPDSFWCYRPIPGTPAVNSLPALDAGAITFGCLNNSAKMTTAALDLWAQVLLAVPQSRLIMLAFEGSLRTDISECLSSKDIDSSRLDFVNITLPNGHMCRYHRIDISLDPIPYTGHTSTLDSLWMGVPVVTLSGKTSVARGSVTALKNVGMNELIAYSTEEYVNIAARLASDLTFLNELRGSLRTRMQTSPLCNELKFTKDLETAYRNMWRSQLE
jgi:protein O-GlcNAc transferase